MSAYCDELFYILSKAKFMEYFDNDVKNPHKLSVPILVN